MCGRFYLDLIAAEAAELFDAAPSPMLLELAPTPRFNIGPGQAVWTVRHNAKTHARSLDALHWGLVPHFSRDRKGAYRCINARSETIDSAASFRAAFAKRRCLVVAGGFYEWRKEGKRKQPFAIASTDGAPLALAGIWENWLDPETGEWLRSVAIVTTAANDGLRALHDRMPVIVSPDDFARWLGEEPASPEQLKQLLHGDAQRAFRIWPVTPRMNRVEYEDPAILEPVALDQPELAPPKGPTHSPGR